jgi:uncharacterized protein with HEPN domain
LSFRDMQQHLDDIDASIARIERFVAGLSFADYQADDMVRSAVERQVEIIAEAVYRLGDDAHTINPAHDWKALKALGNLLRHAYHRIDDTMMWRVVTDDLPQLKASVAAALENLPKQ